LKTYTQEGAPSDLKLLEVNARSMRKPTFDALVRNIKRDGVLTQYPFVWQDSDGVRHVLSGNHRVKAAIAAGLKKIQWIETVDPLTEQQRTAIQLSHNSIAGEDAAETLRLLVEELTDETWLEYAAVNDEELAEMAADEPEVPDLPSDDDSDAYIRMRDIFGTSSLPADAASVVRQAVTKMLERDEITPKAKWRAVEAWAADYLAGA
jgi:hypothetical protein